MTSNPEKVRIDKWLWAVRLYKTRSLAADACKAGHVQVDGHPVKPSHWVRVSQVITAKKERLTQTVKVRALLDRRVGAALVQEFLEDLTPPSEYEKKETLIDRPLIWRPKGLGRPSKKERRALDSLFRSGAE